MQPANHSPVAPDVTALHASADLPTHACDDGQLAARIASGDRQAAEELIRRHQAPVRGFLRAVCYDRSAVDDLAQETFLRALKHAGRFDPRYPMRGWLLTIARRLSINHGQKEKRRRPAAGIEPDQLQTNDRQNPSRRLEQREQRQLSRDLIHEAMHRLTEPQRAAIAMHYQQGLPLDEVAARLEMPVGTIKSHLHRGRAKMREQLERHAERLMP
ncbi:MAG: RNA polymerase sigma factor [Phycisphaeraceae bacterium]